VKQTITLGTDLQSGIGVARAECPAGMSPISGGFQFGGDIVFESYNAAASSWNVGGDNYGGTTPQPLTALAYCSPGLSFTGGF
jgi:hypothetical protein